MFVHGGGVGHALLTRMVGGGGWCAGRYGLVMSGQVRGQQHNGRFRFGGYTHLRPHPRLPPNVVNPLYAYRKIFWEGWCCGCEVVVIGVVPRKFFGIKCYRLWSGAFDTTPARRGPWSGRRESNPRGDRWEPRPRTKPPAFTVTQRLETRKPLTTARGGGLFFWGLHGPPSIDKLWVITDEGG